MIRQQRNVGMNLAKTLTRTAASIGVSAGATAVLVSGCTTGWMPWEQQQPAYPSASVQRTQQPVPAGYYRVNPGDTVAGIAAAFGQRKQDIADWNHIAADVPPLPGQVLRVAPLPSAQAMSPGAGTANGANAAPAVRLAWPVQGPVLKPFVAGKTNGIVIGGTEGETVKAAAAGRVVYAGTGLEAYGPLVIVKHNDSLITAYGHNSKLLVKEDDAVAQGQAIAEMGADAKGAGTLEFEVRRDGKPVDPLGYLPRQGG
ncbi:peptidoglycan DD-metalloendopeptidase family protein [Paraburkholderia kururiensis]|uniref:Peptidoglycan DD-metalloendopeptidase family protein n=1 Tax=Paraburkholderia kururiensis TaxID=984307 RepID=A0ABZ0WQ01_9BURK|nr:peptidoglycan DD-metalloendopeptidase family protein [Paraburkholderia kururiensis]WQD79341.1 peptidoglycan DD-metalloendopeptidase family protein [Paraburkholderia kururiensis]